MTGGVNMTRNTQIQIRLTPDEHAAMRQSATAGGWAHISDMVRDLVNQWQSAQRPTQTAQHQPDLQDAGPPL